MDAERLLNILREAHDRSFDLGELMRRAGIPAKKEKEAKRLLKGLVRDGTLEREPGRRYRISRAGTTLEGRVVIDRRGFPVFVADGDPKKGPGIPFALDPEGDAEMVGRSRAIELDPRPIEGDDEHESPPPGMSPPTASSMKVDHLMHDDRVRVELVSLGRRPRTYARLIKLISRPEQRHVGMFRNIQGACLVELDEAPHLMTGQTRRIREVLIPPGETNSAEDGQLVEVAFEATDPTGWAAPLGRVLEIIGRPGERSTELRKLMIEHDLDRGFPPEVIKQAEAYGDVPTEDDIAGRRDVRHLPLMTIDGETAKDFDDAVCALRDGKGGYKLFVAIADVSHYVRIATPLDEEAFRRGTSTYLTDRAIPMLPEKLSNGLCSLNPGVDRLCMLAEMSVSATGRVLSANFSRAVMRSKARLTYTQVSRALEGEPDEQTQAVLPTLLLLSSLALKLLERRLRRGSLDLDLPEPVVEFDDAGQPTTAVRRPRNSAHRLIEDLMVATNEAAARFFIERRLDTLYRIHAPPDPDKMASFAKLCLELGIDAHVSERPSPAEVSSVLSKLSEHPRGSALHALLLRALSAARYAPDNDGHFGLASESYLHFTSPIRRYPDLVVHRLMKQAFDAKKPLYSFAYLQKIGDDCSSAERKAMLAERASMDLDRALIAQKYVGEKFPATITGVQNFGLFMATQDPFLEGMVPVQSLPGDYYEADEHQSMLQGTQHGHSFFLGDATVARIHSVHLARRQVEMRLETEAAANEGTERPAGEDPSEAERPRAGRLDPRALAQKMGRSGPRPRGRASGRPRGRGSGRPRRGPRARGRGPRNRR